MEELQQVFTQRKRARDDSSESVPESESKRMILSLLDDSDLVDSVSQDLDSVIKSFEEEISGSRSSPPPDSFFDLTSDSGDFIPGLGKGEEGGGELVRVTSESSGIGELWDEIPSFDSFEFYDNITDKNYGGNNGDSGNVEYVELDGIFDYSDLNFGSDFSWRPQTSAI